MIAAVILVAGLLVSSYALLHRKVTQREQRQWTIPPEWFAEWEDLGGEG